MFQDWSTEREWRRQMAEDRAKLKKLGERIKEAEKNGQVGRRLRGWFSLPRCGRF